MDNINKIYIKMRLESNNLTSKMKVNQYKNNYIP